MNHRRDEQQMRQQFGRHNHELQDEYGDRDAMRGGRGADDWRSDSMRSGWGRDGGESRFGGDRSRQGGGEGYGGGNDWDQRGGVRFGGGVRVGGGRESYGYEGQPSYGYGEGMRGGYSYGNETTMRGGSNDMGIRRYQNENLANDFSVEGTRDFSRDERHANARGYGVGSAFEQGGGARISHRGKGPKGFKRSDDRIKELVSEALTDHHGIDASELEVSVEDGEVTLTGTLEDRRLKRLAEDVVEGVPGVEDVHNRITVGRRTKTPEATTPKQNVGANRSQH